MARLALVAMLLLACVPTFGRLATAVSDDSGWSAVCTMSGLKYVDLSSTDTGPAPHKPGGMNADDCAYCPLLTAIAVFALWLALGLPRLPATLRPLRSLAPDRNHFHPCGLGSRGPPLAL